MELALMDLSQLSDPSVTIPATSTGVVLMLWRLIAALKGAAESVSETMDAAKGWIEHRVDHEAAESAHWDRMEELLACRPKEVQQVNTQPLEVLQ